MLLSKPPAESEPGPRTGAGIPGMDSEESLIDSGDPVVVTGAGGFIGSRGGANLQERGFRNIRCLLRPSSDASQFSAVNKGRGGDGIQVVKGNLLSREDCLSVTKDAAVIYHLAAGTGSKSFSESFLNTVVTTRNLLEAAMQNGSLRRFVSLSSFAVYANRKQARRGTLDEACPIEDHPESRGEAYCYAKVKQDEMVMDYGKRHGIPFVLLRPGVVYGPGKHAITGRVGIHTFGVFIHLVGSNTIPFTFVENCAKSVD